MQVRVLCLLLLALFFAATCLPAQEPCFQWVHPRPTGVNLVGVDRFGEGAFIAVGENGQYVITDDAGASWRCFQMGDYRTLRDVDILGEFGIIVGDGGIFYRSYDRGKSWTGGSVSGVVENLHGVHLFSSSDIIAVGGNLDYDGVIVRSYDGGDTWEIYRPAVPVALHGLFFLDSLHGWACGEPGVLLSTVDGGVSWSADTSSAFEDEPLETVSFVSPTRGLVAGAGGLVAATDDGGISWRNFRGTRTNRFYASVWFNDTVAMISGHRQTLMTVNAGDTYFAHSVGAEPLALSFAGNVTEGVMVGIGGKAYRTDDGGWNWTSISSNSGSSFVIRDLAFADDLHGIAVGKEGGVLVTDDGGRIWERGSINLGNGDRELSSVVFPDLTNAVLLRFSGVIYHSSDSGHTWHARAASEAPLFDVSFGNSQIGYAVGGAGDVYKSTNGGASWSVDSESFNVPLYAVHASDSVNAWIGGYDGTLYRTTDAGSSWLPLPNPFTVDFFMIFGDGKGNVTAGWRGGLVRTTDNGENWELGPAPEGSGLLGFSFLSPLIGWCGQYDGPLLSTTDGGDTWRSYEHHIRVSSIGGGAMQAVFLKEPGHGYLAGGGAYILEFQESDSVSTVPVGEEGRRILHHPTSRITILPNPAETYVTLVPELSSFSRFRIIDILGRSVLIVDLEPGGSREYLLDIRAFSSGTYLVEGMDARGVVVGWGRMLVR